MSQRVRRKVIKQAGGAGFKLSGYDKMACQMLVEDLKKVGINSSIHTGYVKYSTRCFTDSDILCSQHYYVLVHDGHSRYYLDVTADQYEQFVPDTLSDKIIFMQQDKARPKWFRHREVRNGTECKG